MTKSTTILQLSALALSAVLAIAFFAIFVLAPSVFWTSNSDWSTGAFTNITNITGDLMLNNTVVNGTTTIYSWFYNNWTYRKAIIINGSTSLQNDYQIPINLTTALYNNTGLVGSWHFTNNDTSDSSGYGNNGVQNGGVNCSVAGKFGTGCGFDGTSGYVDVGNAASLNITGAITIEAWIKPTTFGSMVVAKDFTDVRGYALGLTAAGGIHFEKGGAAVIDSATVMSAGIWNHIVITFDGTNWKSWLNGGLDVTVAGTGIPSQTTTPVTIGRRSYTGAESYFNGTIDEVRIYNRSLSAAEISDQYNASKSRLDYQDLRFTYLNQSSGAEQNISYWLESDNQAWVKVPNVTASGVANTTLYMYYGNPSATSASNGTNTFDFFDDATGTYSDKWVNIVGTGSYATVGGKQAIAIPDSAVFRTSIFQNSGAFIFEGRLYSTTRMTAFEWFQDSTPTGQERYWTRIDLTEPEYIYRDGTQLTAGETFSSASTWVNVQLIHKGSGVYEWRVGGLLSTNYVTDTTYTNGYLVLYHAGGGSGAATNLRIRKYASPEPATLSIGAEQTVVSRGTYLSNITTTSVTIASITPTWNGTNSTNVNFTVEISANNGANWLTAANNTAYTSGGGIGSGTQMKYRINFSTNDTSKTATLSDITLNYIGVVNITCDAGGPYLANSSVMITGNVSTGNSTLASQPVTVQIKNNTVVLNSTVVTSDASGNWVAKLFVNTTNASSVFVNSTYLGVSGNCTYSLSIQSQTVIGTNATCTTNSTACSFKNYPVSGWVMDSGTGSLINSGTIKLSVKETGDTYSTTFAGGYFSISPQFCLSPGAVYSFALSIEGNGKQGFMTYRRAGKT